jgi:hypothetical protein
VRLEFFRADPAASKSLRAWTVRWGVQGSGCGRCVGGRVQGVECRVRGIGCGV